MLIVVLYSYKYSTINTNIRPIYVVTKVILLSIHEKNNIYICKTLKNFIKKMKKFYGLNKI